MLVLTRKVGELIRIGDNVTVQVIAVRGGQVRLGLAAPPDVRIFREEIFRTITDQNRDARLTSQETLAAAVRAWEGSGDAKRG